MACCHWSNIDIDIKFEKLWHFLVSLAFSWRISVNKVASLYHEMQEYHQGFFTFL
jgi:hypothetical protein